jgi:hypothetical protein
MIVWILTILDILVLVALTIVQFTDLHPSMILYYSSAYLALKGIAFRDVMSMIDLTIGIYVLAVAFFGFSSFFYYIILSWFLYKLIFTFFGGY